jgi:diacylglycerol kinase (ATP)
MSRRLALLVNPTAGGGRGAKVLPAVRARLEAGGASVQVLAGRDAADSLRLAEQAVADDVDVLVALGGDGLVSLAAQALAGTTTPLAVVPVGTGNDGARTLGLPLDPLAAAEVALTGLPRTVDLARAGDRTFLTVLSSGFDSRVNERANAMRWPGGTARYVRAMLAELPVFRPVPYELVLDGEQVALTAMLVAVGNGRSYGGGMLVCPDADLSDGLLDVTVLTALPTLRFLRLFPSVYSGAHVRRPEVRTYRARSVQLSAPGMTAFAGGEPVGALPVTVEALPGALTVLVGA